MNQWTQACNVKVFFKGQEAHLNKEGQDWGQIQHCIDISAYGESWNWVCPMNEPGLAPWGLLLRMMPAFTLCKSQGTFCLHFTLLSCWISCDLSVYVKQFWYINTGNWLDGRSEKLPRLGVIMRLPFERWRAPKLILFDALSGADQHAHRGRPWS